MKIVEQQPTRRNPMLNFLFHYVSLVRKFYWFIFRPVTVGVKIIAISGNKVLLIKNRYDKYWYLPGGRVKSGETVAEGARREMKEETGVNVEKLEVLGAFSNFSEYKSDHVIVFCTNISGQKLKEGLEVDRLEFFDFETLPEGISPATMRRITEYRSGTMVSGEW